MGNGQRRAVVRLLGLFLLLVAAFGSRAVEDRAWFSAGHGVIVTGVHDASQLRSESCRGCHEREYADWSRSRHSVAWSNPIFQEGHLVEPKDRCVKCHAPLEEQFAEYKRGGGALMDEGVNCVACHVRDGKVWSGGRESDTWHPNRSDSRFQTAEFCAGCHQFNLDREVNGVIVTTDLVAQNTYEEWKAYRAAGGEKTCQQCHMPSSSHRFAGAHSLPLLRKALKVSVRRLGAFTEFTLSSVGVGHNFPTGDVFRHLRLEVGGRVVAKFGKVYALETDSAGETHQVLKSNTSLEPFRSVSVRVRAGAGVAWRVRYFYVSERGFRMSQLPARDLAVVVASGRLK